MRSLTIRLPKALVVTFLVGTLFGVAVTTVGAAMRGSAVFRDVPSGAYYDDAIGELSGLGIIQGVDTPSGKMFYPERLVNRADVAVLLKRLRDDIKGIRTAPVPMSSSSRSSSVRSSSSSVVSSVSSSSSSAGSAPYNAAGSIRFASAAYSVSEVEGSVKISIVRIGGSQGSVTVNYTLTGGTAVAKKDYTPSSGSLTFAGKETSKSISIPIIDNTDKGPDKTLNIVLSGIAGGATLGNPSTAVMTIIDNETNPTGASSSAAAVFPTPTTAVLSLSASVYSAVEGSTQTVTVVRTGVTTTAVSVAYATADQSAKSGVDYSGVSGVLNFAANETSKAFTIAVNNDTTIQGNRAAKITLSTPSAGASLGNPTTATLTVVDDDASSYETGTGTVQFTSSAFSAETGQQYAVITLSHVGGFVPVTVTFATNGGLAVAGTDYQSVNTAVQFAAGESLKVILVPLAQNTQARSGLSVLLQLTPVTANLSLGIPPTATLTLNQ